MIFAQGIFFISVLLEVKQENQIIINIIVNNICLFLCASLCEFLCFLELENVRLKQSELLKGHVILSVIILPFSNFTSVFSLCPHNGKHAHLFYCASLLFSHLFLPGVFFHFSLNTVIWFLPCLYTLHVYMSHFCFSKNA